MNDRYLNPKKLGFGCMRLPVLEGGEIDHEQLCRMVDTFMERGFTYFDTAYVYHGGKSEVALREALVKRHPRDSFTVATKLPSWELKEKADVERVFAEQQERMGVDFFDFYLLHNINKTTIETFNKVDGWTWLEGLKAKGLAKNVGFSFHDSAEMLDEVLTAHPFVDFVQLQINYIDWTNPKVDSKGVYEVARKHGKAVIVMEPVKGGLLAKLPEEAEAVLGGGSPATYAVRFAASLEGVKVVLSGMSNIAQMEDNSSVMENFAPLTEDETAAVWKVADILNSAPTVPCTSCRYCVEGCPMSIEIPKIIAVLNDARRFSMSDRIKGSYKYATEKGGTAADCLQCGQCEGVCPQHLEIPALLAEMDALLK